MITLLLYGNYEYAGTNKFKNHVIEDGKLKTLCGLYIEYLRGQWEYEEFKSDDIGCLKCKKSYSMMAREIGVWA